MSATIHLTLFLVLAVVILPGREEVVSPAIDSALEAESPEEPLERAAVPQEFTASPGGSTGLAHWNSPVSIPDATEVPVALAPSDPLPEREDEALWPSSDELSQSILGRQLAGLGGGRGSGGGSGSGEGGQRFFDTVAEGKRFVYVLDCSGSMKEPHSEARSRFERLKIELVRAIGSLPASSEFFVIFFNTHAVPMPAKSLQPATVPNKRKYLEWVARIPGGGGTDPREALQQAFGMKPDVVHLLTDGQFDDDLPEDIRRLDSAGVVIHTYCLGDRAGEEILRRIAQSHQGIYQFVP
ncbi:MAG: vWA domain-containing protein [Planctomycetales bacterium]